MQLTPGISGENSELCSEFRTIPDYGGFELDCATHLSQAKVANKMVRISERAQLLRFAPNALPLVLVGGMGGLDLVWNAFAHLHFSPPFLSFAAPAYICFALFTICRILWPNKVALELFLYLGLWTLFMIFGSQLSYLAATTDFPLK